MTNMSASMSVSVDPTVYLKHSSLSASRHDTSVGFKLCSAANHITPGQILGSQQIRGLWKIYLKSENTIPKLLQGDFLYDGRKIELFSQDPFETGKIPSESIIFRDLPFSFNNDHITAHLKNSYPDVYIRSNVINGKVRNSDNELTTFLNGDRYVYARKGFAALPTEMTINGTRCRVWHSSQANKCKRCGLNGHKIDSQACPALIKEPNDNIIFWESRDVFSNFYMCDITVFNHVYKSSEHAYQHAKLDFIDEPTLASAVLSAPTPKDVKQISNKVPDHSLVDWHDRKVDVMKTILRAKVESCFNFKKALLDSGTRTIVEGTTDSFWGIGMPSHIAASTNPDFYNGRNTLGLLLMEVRAEIMPQQKADELPSTSASGSTQPLVTAEDDFDVAVPKYSPLQPSDEVVKSIAGELNEVGEESNNQNASPPAPSSPQPTTSAEASSSSSPAAGGPPPPTAVDAPTTLTPSAEVSSLPAPTAEGSPPSLTVEEPSTVTPSAGASASSLHSPNGQPSPPPAPPLPKVPLFSNSANAPKVKVHVRKATPVRRSVNGKDPKQGFMAKIKRKLTPEKILDTPDGLNKHIRNEDSDA